MNYTEAIIALRAGDKITRTSFPCRREYSINPANENEFCINGNINDYMDIALLATQSTATDWVVVDV